MTHTPYSEYPLWQLKEWKRCAHAVGDSAFVLVMQAAIASKEEKAIEEVEVG